MSLVAIYGLLFGSLASLYLAALVTALGFANGLKLAFRKGSLVTVEINVDQQDRGAK
jgi:hypothetical protein